MSMDVLTEATVFYLIKYYDKEKKMANKKVVMFHQFIGWIDNPNGVIQAKLGAVAGHPRLGNQDWVITSAVVRIDYDTHPVEIETLNTIYKKVGYD